MSWNIKTPGDYINGPLTVAGNVGIGTTTFTSIAGYTSLKINNATNGAILDLAQGDAYKGRVIGSLNGLILESAVGLPVQIQVGGLNSFKADPAGVYTWYDGAGGTNQRMQLNATGLGIGVSPAFKLSAAGVSQFYADSDGIYASGNSSPDLYTIGVNYYNAAGTEGVKVSARPSWKIEHKNSNDALAYLDIGFRAASAAASAFTSRFKIDGFGNIGFGVTPQSWGSNWKAIDIAGGGRLYAVSGTGTHGLCFNGYNNNTNWLYHFSTAASRFELQQSGNFAWFTAPSGTAGNAITWTQAMTLDGSGNLHLGSTSSYLACRLNLQVTNAQPDAIYIRNTAAALSTYWRLGYVNSSNTFHILNQSGVGVYLTDGATSWTGTSDERLKDIIEPISNAVAKVGSLRSVIGKFKTDSEGTRRSFLIAQDVKSVLPEAVDTTNADAFGVRYTEVIPLLVAAIKELTARVVTLENA